MTPTSANIKHPKQNVSNGYWLIVSNASFISTAIVEQVIYIS